MESLVGPIDKLRRLGLTHTEIARRLNVSPQKWNDYKSGALPMPTEKIAVLARIADTDPVNLVGEYMIERAKKKGRSAPVLGAVLACLVLAAGVAESPANAKGLRSHSIHYAKRWLVFRARVSAVLQRIRLARELPPAVPAGLACGLHTPT